MKTGFWTRKREKNKGKREPGSYAIMNLSGKITIFYTQS
jgi:hypothetical protein